MNPEKSEITSAPVAVLQHRPTRVVRLIVGAVTQAEGIATDMSAGQDEAVAQINAAAHTDRAHVFPVRESAHAGQFRTNDAVQTLRLPLDMAALRRLRTGQIVYHPEARRAHVERNNNNGYGSHGKFEKLHQF